MQTSTTWGDWKALWVERRQALEELLGPKDEDELHTHVPFERGLEAGGRPHIFTFSRQLPGIAYVTAELIGRDEQPPNSFGNYELMLALRRENLGDLRLLAGLSYYCLRAPLDHRHTMDIKPACPPGSAISALLFWEYGRFSILGRPAGLLAMVGITPAELEWCHDGRAPEVVSRLTDAGVFPLTDWERSSVV